MVGCTCVLNGGGICSPWADVHTWLLQTPMTVAQSPGEMGDLVETCRQTMAASCVTLFRKLLTQLARDKRASSTSLWLGHIVTYGALHVFPTAIPHWSRGLLGGGLEGIYSLTSKRQMSCYSDFLIPLDIFFLLLFYFSFISFHFTILIFIFIYLNLKYFI